MIPVGISNRHVHLNKEDKDKLFGEDYELKVRRMLKQTGQFSSESVITLKTEYGEIPNVRVIGPLRKYTQVEILESDEKVLKTNAPRRNSGDLKKSASISIVGPLGTIYKENSTIIPYGHVHMSEEDAKEYGLNDGDLVKIKTPHSIIDNVYIKSNPGCVLECHLDKDDEVKYNVHTGDEVEIINEANYG